jgi:SAUR family protein
MEYNERVRRDYPGPACQTSLHPFPLFRLEGSSHQAVQRSKKPSLRRCTATVRARASVMGDDDGAKAASGVKQIVRLRELLHRWHFTALGAKQQQQREEDGLGHGHAGVPEGAVAPAIPPFVLRRLRRTETADSVSDDESCHSPEPPPDVPRGYCPVYVGPEQRRFVIPTSYLAHPVFRLLLEKAEEEFGFRHQGALAIPCETEAFKYILQCVERHDQGLSGGGGGDGACTRVGNSAVW